MSSAPMQDSLTQLRYVYRYQRKKKLTFYNSSRGCTLHYSSFVRCHIDWQMPPTKIICNSVKEYSLNSVFRRIGNNSDMLLVTDSIVCGACICVIRSFQFNISKIVINMKERVSKLTYPTLQHCLRMLYTMNGNSKHL